MIALKKLDRFIWNVPILSHTLKNTGLTLVTFANQWNFFLWPLMVRHRDLHASGSWLLPEKLRISGDYTSVWI
jgi:hypothetical protein